MGWLKNLVRNIVREEINPQPVAERDVLSGSELAIIAYRINNGYLLRVSSPGNSMTLTMPTLIYCADEEELAKQIVVGRAKQKLGVSSSGSGNVAKASYLSNTTSKF